MTLPSGTVTFLFTDIEGSTKLAQEYPNEMPALLARHHEILHQAIEKQNGYVFQIIGDAFCAAFHAASDALTAATDAQRALQNEPWNPTPIKVRMGIHTGTAQLTNENLYSGYATLASTQRIMSAGHGGQVLLSNITRELAGDGLPTDSEIVDLGEKRLKDLLRPERLYQFNISGLTTTFPPLRTLDSFPNNLPVHLTSFIGRENEIDEVKQELNEHRLVTLTGSGGTGKTRLSLQVAAELIEKFDHGIWFVELAPLTDPDLIPQTILSAIGIREQEGPPPLELLKTYLQEKKTLIVLDNCEHLISASAQVVNELLRAAPKIKVLTSSREALGVRGEVSYPVPSLTLPNLKHLPAIESLSQYEAVRLFIDRALLVSPHFVVDKENAPYLAQICHRLDGIPLAIELAAARVKVLSVEQISKRLDDRFRLLTGGARTALPRQQTLRALIDWSYDILDENEQLLLRRLSVFAGGWTLEAAEEVCGSDGIESFDILDLLSQLVNKSLVVVTDKSKSGETRYRTLETIRQYAREKLTETGGGELIRNKHLAYFVKLAKQAEPELYRSNQVLWINKLDDDLDNIRAALEWAQVTDTGSGLQLLLDIRPLFEVRGDLRELTALAAHLLEHYEKDDSLRAQGLTFFARALAFQGNVIEAHKIANQSLELSRAISDKQAEAYSLWVLGTIIYAQGNMKDSFPILENCLALYQSLGDKLGQANATGWLSINHNDMDRSKAYLLESLRVCRELGHLAGIANCLNQLALLEIWEGDNSSLIQLLDEARNLYRQLGDEMGEGTVLSYYGRLAFSQGQYEQALSYYNDSIALIERSGDTVVLHWVHAAMAFVVLKQGDIGQAKEIFQSALRQFQKSNNLIGLVFIIEGVASLSVSQDQLQRAAQLFAWADVMRAKINDQRPPVEQGSVDKDMEIIKSQLTEKEIDEFSEKGRTMTTEQAITLTLEE